MCVFLVEITRIRSLLIGRSSKLRFVNTVLATSMVELT